MSQEIKLKFEKIESARLIRGDVILAEGHLFQCASRNMMLFIDLESRQQKELRGEELVRVEKLELLPKKWQMKGEQVWLSGQELGLGPLHDVKIIGMREFEEMEIVKKEMEKGRKLEYKVVLCATLEPKVYLLVGVELL